MKYSYDVKLHTEIYSMYQYLFLGVKQKTHQIIELQK